MEAEEVISMERMPHHIRQPICHDRPLYRRGRRERAVKVFTVSDESKYLLIQKVPDIKGDVKQDLLRLCKRFGDIDRLVRVDYPDCEQFTRVYLAKYKNFVNAVRAKKFLDDRSFLGSILHVCYAPEMETIDETKEKLNLRLEYVQKVLNKRVKVPAKSKSQMNCEEVMSTEEQTSTRSGCQDIRNKEQKDSESKDKQTSNLKRKLSANTDQSFQSSSEDNSHQKDFAPKKKPRIVWRNKKSSD